MYLSLTLLTFLSVMTSLCDVTQGTLYGNLGKPLLKKDGDFLIGGIFNIGQLSTTKSGPGAIEFDCKLRSKHSLHRAMVFKMTVDAMEDLGKLVSGDLKVPKSYYFVKLKHQPQKFFIPNDH